MNVYKTSFFLSGLFFLYLMLLYSAFQFIFPKEEAYTKVINKEEYKKMGHTLEQMKVEVLEQSPLAIMNTKIVFDGLTYEELVQKLNKNLSSTLTGKGNIFAKRCLELGLDPYLAVAIVLQETGCKWSCSSMVRNCYNVGGMKGSPSCNGTSYQSFSSLDEGIIAFIDNLYYNYYAEGLMEPEQINSKYAESRLWSVNVRRYMQQIKMS